MIKTIIGLCYPGHTICCLFISLLCITGETFGQPLESKNSDGRYEIDILLVYNTLSRAQSEKLRAANSNGHSNTLSDGQVLEKQANTSFTNSQIHDVTFNVVDEVTIDNFIIPRPISNDALTRLIKENNDGAMDEIHAIRNDLAADLVVFIAPNGKMAPCGDVNFPSDATPELGFDDVSTNNQMHAFAVVHVICALDKTRFTLLHEIGHLMHARHTEKPATRVNSPFSYNYGYQSVGQGGFRTIMGNNNKLKKILFWSNPNVMYNGKPTGVEEGKAGAADVARTLSNTAQTIASYRVKENTQ